MTTNQLVTLHHDRAVTSSQTIAEYFGKPHYDVMKVIRRIADQCPQDFIGAGNFSGTTYIDSQGSLKPAYELTRDAFTLVAMSFTGEKALQFKLAYIAAFNQMEAALRQQGQAQVLATLDQAHESEEKLQTQVASLKDELLDTLRNQVRLLTRPQRKRTVNRPVTAANMTQMRELAASGMSTDAIARQLGRSRATVFYALQGATGKSTSAQAPLFSEVQHG